MLLKRSDLDGAPRSFVINIYHNLDANNLSTNVMPLRTCPQISPTLFILNDSFTSVVTRSHRHIMIPLQAST